MADEHPPPPVDRITAAALTLVAERGMSGVTMSAVAAEAGVARQTVYNHFSDVDAIILGYMPSVEHAGFAAAAVAMVRKANPDVLCLCDPILGDDPGGLYVEEDVAVAVRSAQARGVAGLSELFVNEQLGIRAFTFSDPEGYQIEMQSATREGA